MDDDILLGVGRKRDDGESGKSNQGNAEPAAYRLPAPSKNIARIEITLPS